MKSDSILERIQLKLNESDPSNRTLTNIFIFHFKDADGNFIKSVVLDLKNLKVFDGSIENPDVEINVSDDDFYLVGTKQISFDNLIETGKVQVNGNQTAFQKMLEKFRLNA
ncbi:uncharacterized protein LOC129609737 isoform X1 [Condylostylus longicornis]|uniref:uncharacterized protein LOC129609737 isoform X1 n=1 Tax=Condylostylus longicornis TaxID=2530218 RepID=UPI00244DBA6C|nr:uncharacterized protein LOC129609737 isoform X1 [Condylostylus longicornis]